MMIRIEHHVYLHGDASVAATLAEIKRDLAALVTQGKTMNEKLQQIVDSEGVEATALGQLATVVQTQQAQITTLEQQLKDALSGTTLPPEVQGQVDAAFTASAANTKVVQDILAALVPPAPAP